MKLSEKLKIRCPSCVKLYEVSSEDITSETPVFQCVSCETHFYFEFPPGNAEQIPCYPLEKTVKPEDIPSHNAKRQRAQDFKEEMRSCPKCGALNGRRAHECYSCHVIFGKLEGLPVDPTLRAQPSLVRKWKNLVEQFDNQDLHDEFLRSCHELDALKFASLKYEEIKAAQGGDATCEQMLARIRAMESVGQGPSRKRVQRPTVQQKTGSSRRLNWKKCLLLVPLAISLIFVFLGMLNLGKRNLVGVGVALTFMWVGILIMVKGRISLSDFMDEKK